MHELIDLIDFRVSVGIFGQGVSDASYVPKYDLIFSFDPRKPWNLIKDVDNPIIANLARIATKLIDKPAHIDHLEKFRRSFTSLMTHPRQALFPSMCDKIVAYKYNSKQLRKHFGYN